MKQYIITEEQLWELVTSFNCNRHEIRKSVRSCPYNPQAEEHRIIIDWINEVEKFLKERAKLTVMDWNTFEKSCERMKQELCKGGEQG